MRELMKKKNPMHAAATIASTANRTIPRFRSVCRSPFTVTGPWVSFRVQITQKKPIGVR
jgi:hypothetical protein